MYGISKAAVLALETFLARDTDAAGRACTASIRDCQEPGAACQFDVDCHQQILSMRPSAVLSDEDLVGHAAMLWPQKI